MKLRSYLLPLILIAFQTTILLSQSETHTYMSNGVSMEKGIKFGLLTFSLSDKSADNAQEFLTHYVSQERTSWSVSTDLGYLIDKNFGVGLGFSYGQTDDENTSVNTLGIMSDNSENSKQFVFRPFIKNFIPLNPKNQIFIILQTELQYSTEKSTFNTKMLFDEIETNSSTNIYGLGFRPGIMLFVVRNFAVETNVNVLGVSTSVENASTTGQDDTRVVQTDINFKISLLQLNFGFSMYF